MTAVIPWARAVLLRDLDGLAAQIRAYPTDGDVWKDVPGITNPGGTLAIHLAGNLRAFVGAALGDSGYVRDRDAEFSTRGLSRSEILDRIAAARGEVDRALSALPESALARPFAPDVGGARLTVGQLLLHLISHLGYHLGQVDYHRRALTRGASVPGMIAATKLTQSG
jgi:uncharacterized damage-inducible protein DinB